MKTITVISTGEELLNGSIIDTNSSFLSNELFRNGFEIIRHMTLGDSKQSIYNGITYALNDSDIIIISGGLGPTEDDNTVEVIANLFNKKIITDEASENKMISFFSKRGLTLHDYDSKMSFYPEGSQLIQNPLGLAPGFILNENNACIIAIPGVPSEMKKMLYESVIPYLEDKFKPDQRESHIIKISGVKESDVSNAVSTILNESKGIHWGITTKSGLVTLSFHLDKNYNFDFSNLHIALKNIFMDKMLKEGFSSPHEELLADLIQKKLTIATAESCTGGLIAKKITDIAGSSQVFMGGVTTYSNPSKVTLLQVPTLMIDKYGAVSENVASAMAIGVQKLFNVSIGISTTGIAGPGGGSIEKPVGTVCFGYAINSEVFTEKHHFPGNRELVRQISAAYAIDLIRRKIQNL